MNHRALLFASAKAYLLIMKNVVLGPDGGFITGSDFLMDGGVTASYFFGELAPNATK